VLPHIRFNTTAAGIAQRPGPEAGWRLICRDEKGDKAEDFDFVVAAIGLYSEKPNLPASEGWDRFQGQIIHVSALKSADQLAGKQVVVVGFGKSATDAAVESAAVASRTSIIFRHAYWPIPRKLLGILPFKWAC